MADRTLQFLAPSYRRRRKNGGLIIVRSGHAPSCPSGERRRRLQRLLVDAPHEPGQFYEWARLIHRLSGRNMATRIAVLVAEDVLPLWRRSFPDDGRPEAALLACARAVKDPLDEDAVAACRTAARSARRAAAMAARQMGRVRGWSAAHCAADAIAAAAECAVAPDRETAIADKLSETLGAATSAWQASALVKSVQSTLIRFASMALQTRNKWLGFLKESF